MFHVSEEHMISGIFIKHVLEDSPAGRNGTLKTGDRILQVCAHNRVFKLFLAHLNLRTHYLYTSFFPILNDNRFLHVFLGFPLLIKIYPLTYRLIPKIVKF